MTLHRFALRWDTLTLTVTSTAPSVWERLDGVLDPIRLRRFTVAPSAQQHPARPADVELVVEDGPPRVRRTRTGVRITGPHDYWSRGERLACCVLQLADSRRLQTGGLCFHGVALARNGRAVLLTGPSESGKTSTALSVLNRATGPTRMLSNDHVLAELTDDESILVQPNQDVSVAFRSQALWLADRRRYAELVGAHARPVHGGRLRVPAVALGAAQEVADPVPLDAVVFVGVGTTETFEAYPTPDLRATTALSADLAGRVRAANLLPLDDDGDLGPRLPDLCDDVIENTVDRAVSLLVGARRAVDARGPVEQVAAFVDELLGPA